MNNTNDRLSSKVSPNTINLIQLKQFFMFALGSCLIVGCYLLLDHRILALEITLAKTDIATTPSLNKAHNQQLEERIAALERLTKTSADQQTQTNSTTILQRIAELERKTIEQRNPEEPLLQDMELSLDRLEQRTIALEIFAETPVLPSK